MYAAFDGEVIETTHNALGGNSKEQLKGYIERIERLEEQKAELAGDIKDLFDDAKGDGFDLKAMKHVLKLRKMSGEEMRSFLDVSDSYLLALGMLEAS